MVVATDFAVAQKIRLRTIAEALRAGVDGARELVEHPRPGVALVAHETLGDRQRKGGAVRAHAHDFSEQRRRMGKTRRGEIAAHLRLGMLAGRHAPEQLEHNGIADDQRAVRLLRRKPVHLRVRLEIEHAAPELGCVEAHHAIRELSRRVGGERCQDPVGEGRERESISQKAHTPSPPHSRQGELGWQRKHGLVFPRDG